MDIDFASLFVCDSLVMKTYFLKPLMIEDTCGIYFPQEWKSRLKNFVAAVLFEFNVLVQKNDS